MVIIICCQWPYNCTISFYHADVWTDKPKIPTIYNSRLNSINSKKKCCSLVLAVKGVTFPNERIRGLQVNNTINNADTFIHLDIVKVKFGSDAKVVRC